MRDVVLMTAEGRWLLDMVEAGGRLLLEGIGGASAKRLTRWLLPGHHTCHQLRL